jgi:hypothetical protein
MSPAVMKLDVVFRRRACGGEVPTSITARAKTPLRKGVTVRMAGGGPAMAIKRVPERARGVAPKTGAAM